MAKDYAVIGQRETADFGGDGRLVDMIEVRFRTASGTEGTVKVPKSQYTPDTVRERIEDQVSRIVGVEQL